MPDEDDRPSPAERTRAFLGRARRAPGTLGEVAAEVAAASDALAEVQATMARLEELAWGGRDDTRGGVAAIGDELGRVHIRIQDLATRVAELDGAVAGHTATLHQAIAAPARDAAAATLHQALGALPDLADGLSVFVPCWNHGQLLPAAVRSAAAALDRLDPAEQGEVLVLDDASTDDTASVAEVLAAEDPRVRVLHAPANLGLNRARAVLLHAATTTHALQLDADNTVRPEGVEALYRTARATGAALTYGTVAQVGPGGAALGPLSNEPPMPAEFALNYIDSMFVVDVGALRRAGGPVTDPLLEPVGDWVIVHRVVESGLLLAFVPVLVGRYLTLGTALHHDIGDNRIVAGRVGRLFDPTGRRRGPDAMAGVAAVAVDPEAGPLWATPEAAALRPDLVPAGPVAPTAPAPSHRVLVLAPGGVANGGDDAITVRDLERLRHLFGASGQVDLVTDGPRPPRGSGPVRWLGPLVELLPGLDHGQLGRLDAAVADAADEVDVGRGRWRALDPAAYDAAIFLGGGSLVSEWSSGLIAPRAVLAAALRAAAVPYALSGQGIGPLDSATDRALVAGLLGGATAVACRDEGSAALARSLPGVDPARVRVTGDDALGLAPTDYREGGDHRPGLVVTVRRATYVGGRTDGSVDRWVDAADALAAGRGWEVVGVALNGQHPEPEIATLAQLRASAPRRARWRLVECSDDPRTLVAELARAEAIAAQSFHAALLGLSAGVPAVLAAETPYYRAKAEGLAVQAGLPAELAVGHPRHLERALDAVTAALRSDGTTLPQREAAVDAWWSALPSALGLPVASGSASRRYR